MAPTDSRLPPCGNTFLNLGPTFTALSLSRSHSFSGYIPYKFAERVIQKPSVQASRSQSTWESTGSGARRMGASDCGSDSSGACNFRGSSQHLSPKHSEASTRQPSTDLDLSPSGKAAKKGQDQRKATQQAAVNPCKAQVCKAKMLKYPTLLASRTPGFVDGNPSTPLRSSSRGRLNKGWLEQATPAPVKAKLAGGTQAAANASKHVSTARACAAGQLEQKSSVQQEITTLMIRNLPLHVNQRTFLGELMQGQFHGKFNFCYAPTCFNTWMGKGYAFVNFDKASDAELFRQQWDRTQKFNMESIKNPSLRPFVRDEATPAGASARLLMPAVNSTDQEKEIASCDLGCKLLSGNTFLNLGPTFTALSQSRSHSFSGYIPYKFAERVIQKPSVQASRSQSTWESTGSGARRMGASECDSDSSGACNFRGSSQHLSPKHSEASTRQPSTDLDLSPSGKAAKAKGQVCKAKMLKYPTLLASRTPGYVDGNPSTPLRSSSRGRLSKGWLEQATPAPVKAKLAPTGQLEQKSSVQQEITTLMIRNLPLHVNQRTFLGELMQGQFHGKFNFCYAPTCFNTWMGKGYAFVNFDKASDAELFRQQWDRTQKFNMESQAPVLSVASAVVQGLEATVSSLVTAKMARIKNPSLRPFVRDEATPVGASARLLMPAVNSTVA
ncbi:unnamed protein product [Polarella glacialis]|uniref:Mei2-like C-terminal RNA recognition motif domain-containing protein n=1 Tax=Polarella glacialis TaxID=89957 RepID=A0A813DXP0_POLGL|nr:unnamed protein product [Polarella glacialis]